MRQVLFIAMLVVTSLAFLAGGSWGAEFCVDPNGGGTHTDLQSGLTAAQANGENDTIKVVQGEYKGNFTYDSSEGKSITLLGGYTSGCASRVVNPSNTTLDGDGSDRVLYLSNSNGGDIIVEGFVIENGYADTGGGVRAESYSGSGTAGNIILKNNTITGNTAWLGWGEGGGGVYAFSSSGSDKPGNITLENNTITGNTAETFEPLALGGGVRADCSGTSGTVTLTNNTITGNTAEDGGGVCAWSDNITLTNNIITGNTGGGVYATSYSLSGTSGNITLTNNTITENTYGGVDASASSYPGTRPSANITLENNTITGNTVSGGVRAGSQAGSGPSGNITLTNNIISGNTNGTSSGGGGVRAGSSSGSGPSGNITLTKNTISGNTADYGGGGVYAESSSGSGPSANITLTNNTISGNTASTSSGGGVRAESYSEGPSANITLTNNTITGNTADYDYGGVRAESSSYSGPSGDVTLTNNIISGNTADYYGGVYAESSSDSGPSGNITLTNNTISGNTADYDYGGVILYMDDNFINVYNNIIWNNTALTAADIYLSGTGTANGYNNDYSVMSGTWTSFDDNINVNPLFVNPAANDFHLGPGSLCIDAGNPDLPWLPTTDFEGDPRTVGAAPDIGADEFIDVCEGDFDHDGDVDGSDLAAFAAGGTGISLEAFAADFGSTDCPLPHVDYWVSASQGSDSNPGTRDEPFRTISHALSAAGMNKVIKILPGTYDEGLGETFPLVLQTGQALVGDEGNKGDGVSPTLIIGQGDFEAGIFDYATIVGAEGSRVSGFKIGADPYTLFHFAIVVDGITTQISDNTFKGSTYGGVLLRNNGTSLVEENVFDTWYYGIYIDSCVDGPIIRNNTLASHVDVVGPETYAVISGNTIETGDVGICVENGHPLIENNTFNGGYYYAALWCQLQQANPTVRGNIFICNTAIAIEQDNNPDLGTASDFGNNDLSSVTGVSVTHEGTATLYAIGNTWPNWPPVEGTDIAISGTGTVVWGTGPGDQYP